MRLMTNCATREGSFKPAPPTAEMLDAAQLAQAASERLFNAMARPIERLARKQNRSFDDAAIMAQNGVGGY